MVALHCGGTLTVSLVKEKWFLSERGCFGSQSLFMIPLPLHPGYII